MKDFKLPDFDKRTENDVVKYKNICFRFNEAFNILQSIIRELQPNEE
jgi:hypothetical protein